MILELSAFDNAILRLDEGIQRYQKDISDIAPQYEVRAFGSRVNGNPKPFSDLDLALVGKQAIPLDLRAELAHAFSELDLPWRVDLVDWHRISPQFRKIIETGFEVIQTPASSKPNK